MIRFFVERVDGDKVWLGLNDSHHLLRVMRAEPGEQFAVLAMGMEYTCLLEGSDGGRAVGQVVGVRPAAGEPAVRIALFQGLAKGDKMEAIIQHGTEIGIVQFVPVITSRAVIKLEGSKAVDRVQRWQRIAQEAAEQSRRGAVPQVAPLISWKEAIHRCPEFDLALVLWEQGGESLRDLLQAVPTAYRIALFIGPEGGFSAEEVTLARQQGAYVATMGPRILRTETAGLVAATAVLYARGDLDAQMVR